MRDKNFNTGVRGVLLDAQHYERMGSALWLYSWLILRQTHQSGEIGWVLGGSPVSYREIEEETGFNRRTLENWFRRLRSAGYIETTAAPAGVVVRITKAKKYSQTSRKIADGIREVAGTPTRNCVAVGRQALSNQRFRGRISSSFVGRIKDKEENAEIHKHLHKKIHSSSQLQSQNPSGLEAKPARTSQTPEESTNEPQDILSQPRQHYSYNARKFLELLRQHRDEELQRELEPDSWREARSS